MNWLVATQPKPTAQVVGPPPEIVEVRTFVVRAETEAGVRALMEQHQSAQMVRGMVRLPHEGTERS